MKLKKFAIARARLPAREARALPGKLRARIKFSILSQLLKGYSRQVFAQFLTFPPRAGLAMFGHANEKVTIKACPNVARRLIWKWIVGK